MNEYLPPMRDFVIWLIFGAVMVAVFWPACKRAWVQIRTQKGPNGRRAKRLAAPVGFLGLCGIGLLATGDARDSLLMTILGAVLFGMVFVGWAIVVTAAMKEWNEESRGT